MQVNNHSVYSYAAGAVKSSGKELVCRGGGEICA